jgi:hypothetical protein
VVIAVDWVAGLLLSAQQTSNSPRPSSEVQASLLDRLEQTENFQNNFRSFGELDLPNLSNISLENPESINFIVENNLPDFETKPVTVYQIETNQEIRGRSVADELAGNLNLSDAQTNRSTSEILRWESGSRTLEYNLNKNSFNYFNGSVFPQGRTNFPSNLSEIISKTDQLVSELGINSSNIQSASTEVDYLERKGNVFISAVNQQEAEFIKLRIYRNVPTNPTEVFSIQQENQFNQIYENSVINNTAPVVIDDYYSAPVEIILTSDNGNFELENIYSFNYYTWQRSDNAAIYNIISPKAAWDRIKSGRGAFKQIIADGENEYQFGRINNREIIELIADPDQISFAYFEPTEWEGSEYLYPLYIFEGRAKLADSPNSTNASYVIYVFALEDTSEE